MSPGTFTESEVEDAVLAWLAWLGWTVLHGPDIASTSPRPSGATTVRSCWRSGLRDALLPRLISGEIRVKDAERIAAGVT